MNIAILGCGTMGQMLARLIADAGHSNTRIFLANRTKQRAVEFCRANPTITLAADFSSALEQAEVVFLCVQPSACAELLQAIRPGLLRTAHLVSILADVSLAALETGFTGKISRMMPTITSEVGAGITLVADNRLVGPTDRTKLDSLFGGKLSLRFIAENQMNLLSIITSCGPGLWATIFHQLVLAIGAVDQIDSHLLHDLISQTVLGTGQLSWQQGLSFPQLYAKVATQGGITEQGAEILNHRLPAVFIEMLESMLARHDQRSNAINAQFGLSGKSS